MRFMQTHENLVCTTKIYVEKSDVYIVKQRFTDNLMDYMEEEKASPCVKEMSRFSDEIILNFMSQLSSVISHLHHLGYVHGLGELIPQHVYMTDMYSRLVLDVGKSVNVFNEKDVQDRADSYLSNAFVAPEIKRSIQGCEWSKCKNTDKGDVFVLGVIFYMIITLSSVSMLNDIFLPSNEESYLTLVERRMKDVGCDEKHIVLVIRCLSEDPTRRPRASHVHFILTQLEREMEENKLLAWNTKQTLAASEKNIAKQSMKYAKKKAQYTVLDKSMKVNDNYSRFAEGIVLNQSRALHHGWLSKQRKLSKWTERYFFLSDFNYLYCCLGTEEPLTVTHKTKIAHDQFIINANVAVKNSKGFVFKLVTENETLVLSAPTEQAKTEWINALRGISHTPRPLPDTVNVSQPAESLLYSTETNIDIEENRDDDFNERLKELHNLKVRMIDYKNVTIVKKIAQGGFGQVFLVTLIDDITQKKQQFAMKVMLESDMTKDEFRDFLNEVRIMSLLDHPNILPLYGVCCDRERLCIFTKYMSLGGLDAMLANQIFTLPQRVRLLLSVAKGMAYLHSRTPAVIHRDLKPANLLVDESYNVHVSDFGLSRIKTKTMGKTAYVSTWNYMPPEKMRAPEETQLPESEQDRIEEAGDVYSFAIIMYEIVTMLPVFPNAMYPMQIANLVGRGERPKFPVAEELVSQSLITAQEVELYAQLRELITTSWNQTPTKRPSFVQLVHRIEDLLQ